MTNDAKSKVFQQQQRQHSFFDLIFPKFYAKKGSWGMIHTCVHRRTVASIARTVASLSCTVASLARTVASLERTVARLERTVASLGRTVVSPARTVPKPILTKSLHSPFGFQHNLHTRRVAPS